MNQTQRKYLIDKLQRSSADAITEMRKEYPQKPEVRTYCCEALLKGELRIRSEEEILAALKGRLNVGSSISSFSLGVSFDYPEIFILPEEYTKAYKIWEQKYSEIQMKITTLKQQTEALCTRIQLASDKTLERMIAEVDDMGDITFVDCTLKRLMTKTETKIIDAGSYNVLE